MIPSGLKIGDTFTDNGRTYEVTKICEPPYLYESRAIEGKVSEKPVETVEEKPVKKYSKTQIMRMSNKELIDVCVSIGIEPKETGTDNKKAIIEKLGL